MSKIILVYANCGHSKARGDFALAGNIAKDLAALLQDKGSDIQVVLTSTLDGVPRFESIYGKAIKGKISVETQQVGLCALELFDTVNNEVVAFIEANRCKYAPADILKRVLSPNSKMVVIGAANQPDDLNKQSVKKDYLQSFSVDQPHVYEHFNTQNICIGSAGIGGLRMGLPIMTNTDDLPGLSLNDMQKMPKNQYGFLYLAALDIDKDARIIAQYTILTGFDSYILVGEFAKNSHTIQQAISKEQTINNAKKSVPSIECHASLDSTLMRKMTANCSGDLLVSTGVMSTLEAMNDGKLPYYQDMSTNEYFMASYLLAVKSICSSGQLFDNMPQLVMGLSELLFAAKPLSTSNMDKLQSLLRLDPVRTNLKDTNSQIVSQANGKLAPKLLSFINNTSGPDNTQAQLNSVCMGLRKQGEMNMPVHDQALRRAACWGKIFELKVLIRSIKPALLNKKDSTAKEMNALHHATSACHTDCVKLLLQSPDIRLDIQDGTGQTALHHAVRSGKKEIVQELMFAGAAPNIKDNSNHLPADYGNHDMQAFIKSCMPDTTNSMNI